MTLAIDIYERGRDMYKSKYPRPIWDGTGATSWLIDGWDAAAKEAGEPGYKCTCVSFDCPYHAT